MKKLVLLSLLSATLFSCSDEKVEIPVQNAQNLPISGACSFELQKSDPTGKGSIWNWADYRWPNQSNIKIKFLGNDGTNTDLKSRIKRYANLWLRHANVNFEFVSSTSDADIKIVAGNEGSTGNWSYCGIYCKRLAQNVPTMSIGDLNVNGTESWLRATVLHEFGHALGLIHEHKSPNCDKSNWNKEAIISRYIAEQGWTRDYVIQQIFNNEDPYWLDVSTYDRNSIMHYPFSASEMGTATGINNRELSIIDINFMSGKYPFTQNVVTIYPNSNFGGTAISLPVGEYSLERLNALGINDNDISSLIVNSGYEIELYWDNSLSGDYYTVKVAGNSVNLGNFDNQTSAIKIKVATPNVVDVYEFNNYGGGLVGLPVGKYDFKDLRARGVQNDWISSITTANGYQVVVYDNDNLSGRVIACWGNTPSLVPYNFDNIITSIEVKVKTDY